MNIQEAQRFFDNKKNWHEEYSPQMSQVRFSKLVYGGQTFAKVEVMCIQEDYIAELQNIAQPPIYKEDWKELALYIVEGGKLRQVSENYILGQLMKEEQPGAVAKRAAENIKESFKETKEE